MLKAVIDVKIFCLVVAVVVSRDKIRVIPLLEYSMKSYMYYDAIGNRNPHSYYKWLRFIGLYCYNPPYYAAVGLFV